MWISHILDEKGKKISIRVLKQLLLPSVAVIRAVVDNIRHTIHALSVLFTLIKDLILCIVCDFRRLLIPSFRFFSVSG